MLKISQTQSIDVDDFDDLVQKTYGKVYAFQQQNGCKDRGVEYFTVPLNNPDDFEDESIPEEVNGREMGVSFDAWLKRDPKQPLLDEENGDDQWKIDLFWERNFYPSLDMVVSDLYKKGLIPAGDYQIVIDW